MHTLGKDLLYGIPLNLNQATSRAPLEPVAGFHFSILKTTDGIDLMRISMEKPNPKWFGNLGMSFGTYCHKFS
jgi:hypothetical protein